MKKVSFIVMFLLSTYALSAQSVFWVANDGDNTSGDGSEGSS